MTDTQDVPHAGFEPSRTTAGRTRNETALDTPPESVTIEIGGQTYAGTYRTGRGFVALSSAWGNSYAQRGPLKPLQVAKMLLRGLVEKGEPDATPPASILPP